MYMSALAFLEKVLTLKDSSKEQSSTGTHTAVPS